MQPKGDSMKRIKLTAILLAFLCFLTACGTSAGSGNAPDAEEPVNEEMERTPTLYATETPEGVGAAA